MARRTQRKITHSSTYEAREDGRIISRTYHNTFTIGSEEDYVKFYFTGLSYMKDMPPDCFRLLIYLLPHVRYAEPPDSCMADYSLAITIDPMMKKRMTEMMGYKNVTSVSNLLTELVYGGVLYRVANSVHRLNPHLLGRGNVKDMGEMRACHPRPLPTDTFMSVYNKTVQRKKAEKDGQEIYQSEPVCTDLVDPDVYDFIE